MKVNSKKNSLALLCILAGIVYLFILIPTVSDGIAGGIQGIKERKQYSQNDKKDHSYDGLYPESHFLNLKVKDKRNYYPDSILNRATHTTLPSRIKQIDVFCPPKQKTSLWSLIFTSLLMLGTLPIAILLIFIPILFYKLIFSLYKNNIFTQENVNRIQQIGLFCIIIYAYMLVFDLHLYYEAKSLIDLEHYDLAFPELTNEVLLFGVIALIVATVMKRAMAIKEEQDLTI